MGLASRNSLSNFDNFKGLRGLSMMALEMGVSIDHLGYKSMVWSLGAIRAQRLERQFLLC